MRINPGFLTRSTTIRRSVSLMSPAGSVVTVRWRMWPGIIIITSEEMAVETEDSQYLTLETMF